MCYVLKEVKQAEEVQDEICYFVPVVKIETLLLENRRKLLHINYDRIQVQNHPRVSLLCY